MSEARRVGVYGVGHFGFAMLRHLEQKAPERVSLIAYDRNEHVRRGLREERHHPIHGAPTPIDPSTRIAESVAELVAEIDTLVLAVTSNSTREVAATIAAPAWSTDLTIVNTAKALDFETGRRLSELVREEMDRAGRRVTYAALAGGTIAGDLLRNDPMGMTVACEDVSALPGLRRLLSSPSMWVEATTDLAGVEYAGAFKNVVSICAGMAGGLGHSIGTVTHLISRLAREIEEFCVRRLGADRRTFSTGSQAWGSDLWMSCTGETRNQALGRLLGQGMSLEEANRSMAAANKTVEGVQTLRAIRSLVGRYGDELPLLTIAQRIILDGAPASALIDELMRDDERV